MHRWCQMLMYKNLDWSELYKSDLNHRHTRIHRYIVVYLKLEHVYKSMIQQEILYKSQTHTCDTYNLRYLVNMLHVILF